MRPRILTYFIKQAIRNILNNRMVHVISIGTISISMFLFGAFLFFFVNLSNWMTSWGESLSMSVYLEEGISGSAKKNIELKLKGLSGAEITGYISKEKAKEELIEALGDQAGLLDAITENPLPASYEILFRNVTRNPIDPKHIKKRLEKEAGVEEVQYSEQWLERLEGMIYIMKVAGMIISGLLCIAVLFIISNTVKLMIYARQDEIKIYKLVGATDWFVKIPFLIEGAIQGVVSGLIAISVLFLIYRVFSLKTIRLFGLPVMDIIFLPDHYLIYIMSLSLGLGLLASFIALGRFFRFQE